MNATEHSSTRYVGYTNSSTFLPIDNSSGYLVIGRAMVAHLSSAESFDGYVQHEKASPAARRREKLMRDPAKRAAIIRARKKIAGELDDKSPFSLSKLRLSAGLSQAELADRLGTQQPAIARLEKGEVDPQLSTITKLAEALGTDVVTVISAINHIKTGAVRK